MPYPQDPIALKLRAWVTCPNNHTPLILETKDQQSTWMGQLRCGQCGYITEDAAGMMEVQYEARRK